MAELVAEVPASALAIYAHPDDPEVSCGGTLARWAAAGAVVHVAICCLGDKGTSDPRVDGRQLAKRRAVEVERAAGALGLSGHHLMGYGDGELDDGPDLRGRLVELVRRLRPDTVVCPDPTAAFFGRSYINHRDHRVV